MSLILNIDTATETALVSFSKNGKPVSSLFNTAQKDHAAFLQVAIQQLVTETGILLKNIDAIAVTAGPGSYTGLRVGMASAKGLCYALGKPLITLNTLEVMAAAAIQQLKDVENCLFCPMIDARRMEVFTATYNKALKLTMSPSAIILNEHSFLEELDQNRIVFFGSGSTKWATLCRHSNASFADISITPEAIASLSDNYKTQLKFTELAYAEPFYLKEFNDTIKS
jgi:tRNA threonylcarbamoyladenosine biosynthesis protein TsaB